MYNYLSSIFLLIASISYGPTFVLSCSSIYDFYKQNTKYNASKLTLFLSLYLFGISYTLYYSLIGLLTCILYNYDVVISKLNKIKKEYNEFSDFYNKENSKETKNAHDSHYLVTPSLEGKTISKEIEFMQQISMKYDNLIIQYNLYKNKLTNNDYYKNILQYLYTYDYEYYIEYTNTLIGKIMESINEYIYSEPTIKKYKNNIDEYLQKFKSLNSKFNDDNSNNNNITQIQANAFDISELNNINNINNMMQNMQNIQNIQNIQNMQNMQNIPDLYNPHDIPQPSIEDIDKLMSTLNTLQKMSFDIENLNQNKLSRSQRRLLDKQKSKK